MLFILPLESPAILWGEAYVVVTQDYRTVKYLRPGNSPETVLLVAENPTIPPTEISRSLILRLFKVLGWMRRTAA